MLHDSTPNPAFENSPPTNIDQQHFQGDQHTYIFAQPQQFQPQDSSAYGDGGAGIGVAEDQYLMSGDSSNEIDTTITPPENNYNLAIGGGPEASVDLDDQSGMNSTA